MRENKYLYTFYRNMRKPLSWCLIATSFMFATSAHANESMHSYDSSIQRSNFLSTNPDYEKQLEEELSDRRTVFLWKLRFDTQSLQTDGNIQSQNVGATGSAKFNYELVENLKFKSKVNLSLESGRSQDIFGDQEPNSGIYPRELKVEWTAVEEILTIDFGQIHQRFFNQPLFIGNLGFPGVSEKVGYEGKRFDVSLRAQQLIPTSYTRANRVGEKEETPQLFTESLEGRVRLSRLNFLTGRLTHYQYKNLPSIVAFDSFLYGNTVTNADQNNAEFIYGFEGLMTQLGFEQKFSDSLAGQLQWTTIKNSQAPDAAGEAQAIRVSLANDFGRWIVSSAYKNYFIESDAVPAAYNSHTLGHNNRIGNSYEFAVESKDWGIIFKGSYTKADLLNQSVRRLDGLQQDNQQTIYFSVETMYDFI